MREKIEEIGCRVFGKEWRKKAKLYREKRERERQRTLEENVSKDRKKGLGKVGFSKIK